MEERVQGVKDPKGSSEMLLDLIDQGEWGGTKKDIAEIERMLKALIRSFKNRPLTPGIPEP